MANDDEGKDLRKALAIVMDGVIGGAVLLTLGVFAGNWLDEKLHTAPWCSVGLAILGGGLGLARMVARVNALEVTPRRPERKGSQGAGEEPMKRPNGSGESGMVQRSAHEEWLDE